MGGRAFRVIIARMRIRALLISFPVLLVGCADTTDPDDEGGLELIFAPLSADGCQAPSTGSGKFPDGVDTVKLSFSGYSDGKPDDKSLATGGLKDGAALIEKVRPGTNLTLDIVGCASGEPAWSGRATGLTVAAGEKYSRTPNLTHTDAMSCAGAGKNPGAGLATELTVARAFPSLVTTAAGHVLVIGGFDKYALKNNQPEVSASSAAAPIVEYVPSRGVFSTWSAGLSAPRGFHAVVALDGQNRFLVIGGAEKAVFGDVTGDRAPLAASGEPLSIEVVDATARTVTDSTLSISALPMAAVAADPSGKGFCVAGGSEADGFPSNSLLFVADTADQIAGGLAKVGEGKLLKRRMGATATWLPSGDVVVLGGNTDTDPNSFAELLSDSFESEAVVVTGLPGGATAEPFGLHSAVLAPSLSSGKAHVIIVAGGAGIQQENDATIPEWIPANSGPVRLFAVTVDTGAKTANVQSLDAGLSPALLKRVFGQLTTLGDKVIWSGGYNQLGKPSSPDAACKGTDTGCYFDDVAIRTVGGTTDAVTLEPVTSTVHLGRARFGHAALVLPSGTVLFAGGVEAVSEAANTLSTQAEVLNPPQGENPCQ
mgnify:CR=1 FL=1